MNKLDILRYAEELERYIVSIRRHIHENPELSGKEYNTVRLIIKELEAADIKCIEVENGGVLGIIEGNSEGKTILLRADMDALPVQESPENLKQKKACVSKIEGVSHVCGHDSHTAMLLAAGKILNSHRGEFCGKVILLFERGEEGGGNLKYLIDYLLKNNYKIDGCWGIHVNNEIEGGKFAIRQGQLMAGAFIYDITLVGKGGHGSRPDLTNNPVDCFVAIQNGLNTIRMKSVDPNYALTFSTCKLMGSMGGNIVGEKLDFGGTVRYFNLEKAGKPFVKKMKEIIENTAIAFDCKVEYNQFSSITVPLINNQACFEIAENTLISTFGRESVIEGPLKYGSETMAYLMSYYPGMYLNMGIRNDDLGSGAGHHTPAFDLDETFLKKGVAATVAYAINFLADERKIDFTPFKGSIFELYGQDN